MNTLNKRAGMLLTGLFLLAGAGLFAEPMGDDGPGFGSGPRGDEGKTEGRFEEMNKELGLTKEQAEKLRAHRRSQRETNQALWKQMEEKREALRAELEKPKVDSGKAKSINEELKALHNKMAEQRLAGVLQVREILTAEQFKKLREIGEKRRGGGEGRPFQRRRERKDR
ncbi:MAG: periplasmic heavy metal sensor [Elusimicrobia bacterium]|nr:periplasmic heavy metal sensor [Elusimicrobiota bacterium]MBK7688372.1 periplasmic heavy metal sensor [Elusimicrobiota bacterium]MBP8004409.1 periplasmic heavy metal sensor [Elusimicrobiota bacterium]